MYIYIYSFYIYIFIISPVTRASMHVIGKHVITTTITHEWSAHISLCWQIMSEAHKDGSKLIHVIKINKNKSQSHRQTSTLRAQFVLTASELWDGWGTSRNALRWIQQKRNAFFIAIFKPINNFSGHYGMNTLIKATPGFQWLKEWAGRGIRAKIWQPSSNTLSACVCVRGCKWS